MDGGQRKSILIVDDDEQNLDILASLFRVKYQGLSVYTATNGRSGLEFFKENMPDIVVTDLYMPELDGVQMARRIHEIRSDTKLMVVTGDTDRSTLNTLMGEGIKVDHFIQKPIDIKELFTAVDRFVE